MRKIAYVFALILVALTWSSAWAEFYVIPVGGPRVGTEIKSLPYTIRSPGFYYLTKNLTATGAGITVNADDVTIDLMGFCLTGPESGTNRGIEISANRSNVEIRNGSIKSFGEQGIYSASNTNNIRVLGIRSTNNGSDGIGLYADNSIVMNCSAFGNGGFGIYVGYCSLAKGNQVRNNSYSGIVTNYGSMVAENVSQANNGSGIHVQYGSSVIDNSVYNNSGWGILAWPYSTITRNTAYGNTDEGLNAGNYCTIIGNTVDGLTHGTNCTVKDNTVH